MPRIPFQKPKKVEWEISSERYGRLVAEPFEKGYALTVGNSLRRTLLSIVPGRGRGVGEDRRRPNADTPIPGVKESTADVLLNLKKLAIQVPSGEPRTVAARGARGPRRSPAPTCPRRRSRGHEPRGAPVHARERAACRSSSASASAAATSRGRSRRRRCPRARFALDSAYSPITARLLQRRDVAARQDHRLREAGRRDLDQRRGQSPDEALERRGDVPARPLLAAARRRRRTTTRSEDADGAFLREALGKPLEELRAAGARGQRAEDADITLVADLAQKTESDLVDVKNLGEKSIDEIKAALAGLGLSLGMRIDPNVLGALGPRRSHANEASQGQLQARAA